MYKGIIGLAHSFALHSDPPDLIGKLRDSVDCLCANVKEYKANLTVELKKKQSKRREEKSIF